MSKVILKHSKVVVASECLALLSSESGQLFAWSRMREPWQTRKRMEDTGRLLLALSM